VNGRSDESRANLLAASRGNHAHLIDATLVAATSPQAKAGEAATEMSNSKTRRSSMALNSCTRDETEFVSVSGSQPKHLLEERSKVLRPTIGREGDNSGLMGLEVQRLYGVVSSTVRITRKSVDTRPSASTLTSRIGRRCPATIGSAIVRSATAWSKAPDVPTTVS